jgi:hypothetical protein
MHHKERYAGNKKIVMGYYFWRMKSGEGMDFIAKVIG